MDPFFFVILAIPILIVAAVFLLGFLLRRERKAGLGMGSWRPPALLPRGRRSPPTEPEPSEPPPEEAEPR